MPPCCLARDVSTCAPPAPLSGQIERLPDAIVHVHDYKSAFYAWLATRRRRVPLVATLHGWVENSRSQRLYHRVEMTLLKKVRRPGRRGG